MKYGLNTADLAVIEARLGGVYPELVEIMLDVDVPPIFLFSDERPRVTDVRTRAVEILDLWAQEEPDTVTRMVLRLPEVLQSPSAAQSLLEAVTWPPFFDLPDEIFQTPRLNSRVFAAAPELAKRVDESGLVNVSGMDARSHGLHMGGYAFHYHQLLRRGFSSNVHYELVSLVLRVAAAHDLTARLALDDRRLRHRDEYEERIEHDYWFGPTLSEADLDSLSVVGETFHGDPAGGTSLLNPYAGLSVRWSADGTLKGVEIEEFLPCPEAGTDWVLARYLHAIRDTSRHVFVHCDGAVKAFSAATYPRTQWNFRLRGKGDRYRKLFRIDGKFPAAAWSELACSWFRGNTLILEYFSTLRGTD